MTCVIREGDATTTGGVVLQTSGTQRWKERRVARMGDLVWCPVCNQVGFIAQGNPTFIDQIVAVATEGQLVRCACPFGEHRLIASQDELTADMQAAIDIPKDKASQALKQAEHLTRRMLLAAGPPRPQ
jgi:uncharacterized Zn-binding protein involved in type VI secretion